MPSPRDTLRQVEAQIETLRDHLQDHQDRLQENLENSLAQQIFTENRQKNDAELNFLMDEVVTAGIKKTHPAEDLSQLTPFAIALRQVETVFEINEIDLANCQNFLNQDHQRIQQGLNQTNQEYLQVIAITQAEITSLRNELSSLKNERDKIKAAIKDGNSADPEELKAELKTKKTEYLTAEWEYEKAELQLKDYQFAFEQFKTERNQYQASLQQAPTDLNIFQTRKQKLTALKTQLTDAQQKAQTDIINFNKLQMGLTDEAKEILSIDNFATAEQKLTEIHKKTVALAAATQDAGVKTRIEKLHQQRTKALSEIKKETGEANKKPLIYLQEILADASQMPGMRVKPKKYKGDNEEEINKILKTAKTYHSFTYAGMEFYRNSDGSFQATKNTPLRAKALVAFTLKELENTKQPLEFEIDYGSDHVNNIAAKHALAMGANWLHIVDPDEDGAQWNEIFKINGRIPAEKLLSSKSQSKTTELLKALIVKHGEKASVPLISKVLSAYREDGVQIARILNDLTISKDAKTYRLVMNQLPSVLSAMTNDERNIVFANLKEPTDQVKLLEAFYQYQQKDLGTKLFGWMKLNAKAPAYLTEILESLDENSCNSLKAELVGTNLANKFPELTQVAGPALGA